MVRRRIKKAVEAVIAGDKLSTVSNLHGIPRQTIQKKVKLLKENKEVQFISKSGSKPVFNIEQEKILMEIFLKYESELAGLTSWEVRRITYDVTEQFQLKHNFNKKKQLAGEDKLAGFKARHSQLAWRKPEHTSAARVRGFNRHALETFYYLLKKIFKGHNILPQNIYNMDETSASTVPKSASKMLSLKGKKQVGGLISGERGEHVTAAICFSATGVYVPLLLIFPRKNSHPDYLVNKPEGSTVEFHPSGLMQMDIFFK